MPDDINNRKIYLAGPEVFLPNAAEALSHKKKLCSDFSFVGLSPFDSAVHANADTSAAENENDKSSNERSSNDNGKEKPVTSDTAAVDLKAEIIFQQNCRLIDACDIVVVNCNAFRGACMDDGSAWEIGYAFARGKKIYGFIDRKEDLVSRSKKIIRTQEHPSGYLIDEQGYLLNEDFGNSINLMMEISIKNSGGKLVQGDFETCLKELADDLH